MESHIKQKNNAQKYIKSFYAAQQSGDIKQIKSTLSKLKKIKFKLSNNMYNN